LENLLLRELPLDAERQDLLPKLTNRRIVPPIEEVVTGDLLRDRAAARHPFVTGHPDVVHDRLQDRDGIDAGMLEEAVVLCRDQRIDQNLRDLLVPDGRSEE